MPSMDKLSKRQIKRITRFLEEKAARSRGAKFQHRSASGDGRRKESTVGLLAGRVDQVVIVASFVSPPLKAGLIDRFLVVAAMERAEPVIVFNKADLLESRAAGEKTAALYRSLGYRSLLTSTVTGEGVELLREGLRDSTSLLAGHSGVGKSSLLNALRAGDGEEIEARDVSEATGKGVHTTTSLRLYRLDEKTAVFDLPGVKLVSLYDLEPAEVRRCFPEFAAPGGNCRYRDCLHVKEPECGVKAAVEKGDITRERYDSYVRLIENPMARS